ncbi:SIR2 family NAD-dependent protein deacylase [Brevundimonas sp. TSRC1-1]|uniref:SIR2 family NAD-dependent protein deacylase n=1 Tax=Brevundimonas sp. TSRC1-1 TaxID=2804562 RepID=UPI003CF8A527
MATAIYGDPDLAPSDALRLAEEYRTYFGQAALDDLIRTSIPDAAWNPGKLHRALVELPWADILTTNYDTLVERAAEDALDRHYSVVRTEGDLARFSAPRIVKLHGTVGIDDGFVIAEEDYRTYPARHAAFVNATRQVFIENELCLFGFSGDDPNFLAWSGWVRDHLAGAARRIYLVGVLNLAPAKRRLLEARNISPIDLAPLVTDLDPSIQAVRALEAVMAFLKSAEPASPADWEPTHASAILGTPQVDDREHERSNPEFAAERIRAGCDVLASDRLAYPGWVTAPAKVRHQLRWQTENFPYLSEEVLGALGPASAARYVRELSWRHRVGYLDMDDVLVRQVASALAAPETSELTRADRLELAVDLARQARRDGDDDTLRLWVEYVRREGDLGSDVLADAEYQLCLAARDRLDLDSLDAGMNRIAGADPIWMLRLAGLHCDLGEFDHALGLVRGVVAELRRRVRSAPDSVWLMSRLAWGEWLARALSQDQDFEPRSWSNAYKDWRSDPFDLLDSIRSDLQSEERKRKERERDVVPDFEPGVYNDPRKVIRFTNPATSTSLCQIARMLEDAGAPLRLRHYTLASETFIEALEQNPADTLEWHIDLIRGVKSVRDVAYATHFSRIAIARMSQSTVDKISTQLSPTIAHWRGALQRDRRSAGMDHLPLLTETLGRLAIRASASQAIAAFLLAMDLAADTGMRFHWMFEPIDRLARGGLLGLTGRARAERLNEIIAFPLSGEAGMSARFSRWPRASGWLGLLDWASVNIATISSGRIDSLLNALDGEGEDRQEACLRLFYLHQHHCLTPDQAARFGQGLWSQLDSTEPRLPVGHGLYLATLADMPHPDDIDVEGRLRLRLYGSDELPDHRDHLDEIFAAGTSRRLPRILPGADAGRAMFDKAVSWRPKQDDEKDPLRHAFSGDPDISMGRALGQVVGGALGQVLSRHDRTADRLAMLVGLISTGRAPYARVAAPYFAMNEALRGRVVDLIRDGLLADDFHDVAASADAVLLWSRAPDLGVVPDAAIEQMLVVFEARRAVGLHAVIRILARLIPSGLLERAAPRLERTLLILHLQTRYEAIALGSWDAVSVSLLRAACVGLAVAMAERFGVSEATKAWATAGASDPLPEVRAVAAGDPDPNED